MIPGAKDLLYGCCYRPRIAPFVYNDKCTTMNACCSIVYLVLRKVWPGISAFSFSIDSEKSKALSVVFNSTVFIPRKTVELPLVTVEVAV